MPTLPWSVAEAAKGRPPSQLSSKTDDSGNPDYENIYSGLAEVLPSRRMCQKARKPCSVAFTTKRTVTEGGDAAYKLWGACAECKPGCSFREVVADVPMDLCLLTLQLADAIWPVIFEELPADVAKYLQRQFFAQGTVQDLQRIFKGTGTPHGPSTEASEYTTFWVMASPTAPVNEASPRAGKGHIAHDAWAACFLTWVPRCGVGIGRLMAAVETSLPGWKATFLEGSVLEAAYRTDGAEMLLLTRSRKLHAMNELD
eukprot:s7506_g1.t1